MNNNDEIKNDQSNQPVEDDPNPENYPLMNEDQSIYDSHHDSHMDQDQPMQSDPQMDRNMTTGRMPEEPMQTRVMDKPTHTESPTFSWFSKAEIDDFRSRWNAIQVQFVDSPCSAVEQGDTLVAEILERVKQAISNQQQSLNKQWINHDDISTEELRLTLQNYRSFLDYLLKS